MIILDIFVLKKRMVVSKFFEPNLRTREAKGLFVLYVIFFIFGTFSLFLKPFLENNNSGLESSRYSFLILSSCFAGAVFIVIMDYTFSVFEERPLSGFQKSAGWYFSLAMCVWVIRGATYFFIFLLFGASDLIQKIFYSIEPAFSTFNSAFLILGAARLDFEPEEKPNIIDWKIFRDNNYFWAVAGLTIFAQLIVVLYYWDQELETLKNNNYAALPDIFYGLITTLFLLSVLWKAFKVRNMPLLGLLVIGSLSFAFAYQVLTGFKMYTDKIQIDDVPIGYYYVGSLEILIFGLLVSFYGKKSLQRAKANAKKQEELTEQYRELGVAQK